MASIVEERTKPKQTEWLAWLASSQAFWVFVAVCAACIFLSFATNSFATSNNLFNVTRNFTFVAIDESGKPRPIPKD